LCLFISPNGLAEIIGEFWLKIIPKIPKFQSFVSGFIRNILNIYKIAPWLKVFNANKPLGEIKRHNV